MIGVLMAAGAVVWIAAACAARGLVRNPRGEVSVGLAIIVIRVYARLVHRLRVDGREHVPPAGETGNAEGGPLVVVANHTAGVDPLLVQACVPFEISWLMLRRMMLPGFEAVWAWTGVIPVDPADGRSAREAIKRVQAGAVIGIFAEGGIARPARVIRPFEPGVGLIVSRTRARVLQVVIDGTPQTATAWGSLVRTSRARVRFLPLITFDKGTGAAEIAAQLQARLEAATGWPVAPAGAPRETAPARSE